MLPGTFRLFKFGCCLRVIVRHAPSKKEQSWAHQKWSLCSEQAGRPGAAHIRSSSSTSAPTADMSSTSVRRSKRSAAPSYQDAASSSPLSVDAEGSSDSNRYRTRPVAPRQRIRKKRKSTYSVRKVRGVRTRAVVVALR